MEKEEVIPPARHLKHVKASTRNLAISSHLQFKAPTKSLGGGTFVHFFHDVAHEIGTSAKTSGEHPAESSTVAM